MGSTNLIHNSHPRPLGGWHSSCRCSCLPASSGKISQEAKDPLFPFKAMAWPLQVSVFQAMY